MVRFRARKAAALPKVETHEERKGGARLLRPDLAFLSSSFPVRLPCVNMPRTPVPPFLANVVALRTYQEISSNPHQ